MSYIRVERRKLEGAASAVDGYVSLMNNKMRSMESEIATLASAWKGKDFTQFASEFDKINNNDSTHKKMIKAMESYSSYLRFASSKYNEAQARAINRANSLPRW